MIISDLNLLETVEAGNVVGGFKLDSATTKIKVSFNANSDVDLSGHLATAESDASAFGKATLTAIQTNTLTTPYSSKSSGTSLSATGR